MRYPCQNKENFDESINSRHTHLEKNILRFVMKNEKLIMNGDQMQRTLEGLSYEILERISDFSSLALIGIQRRGVDLARRIKKILEQKQTPD